MPIENEFYGYDFFTDEPKKEAKIIPIGKLDYRDRLIKKIQRFLKWCGVL